ncbi:uncharacterized protein LOC114303977 [Camellia sinensis]|uniref:uncharacterized protein LOC114303977 n=1 Tax=Camellia sinensis TaxID=4442 RepID=UPI0010368D57|nr:uncharacterized protein LOC114284203 isoform X2 [Camellia sinensis]XP_028104961.1 uncharacterized protein LOC114303977 [Camellia sinensis]
MDYMWMFYGVVKSYDSEHKKYVVLYDDGDVEVLRLDKERWELVDNGHKPTKVEELARLSLIQLLSILMWMMGGRSKVEGGLTSAISTNLNEEGPLPSIKLVRKQFGGDKFWR